MIENLYQLKQKHGKNFIIEYIDEGSGFPIFMLPPLSSPAEIFHLSIQELKKYFRVISLNYPWWTIQPGYHTTQPPVYSNFVKYVIDAIQTFKLKHFGILANSISSSFTTSAINKGSIRPTHVLFISPILDFTDATLSPSLMLQYNLSKFISQKTPKLEKYAKLIAEKKYARFIQTYIENFPNESSKKEIAEIIFETIQKHSIRDTYLPPVTAPKHLVPMKRNWRNIKVGIMYGKQEPIAFRNTGKRLSEQLNIEPKVVPTKLHAHFALEPEKSLDEVIQFFEG